MSGNTPVGSPPSPGDVLFARYAYPPNALGYCGPGDSLAVLEHAAAGVGGRDLRALAARFEGAWPYLQLIAATNGVADPLDRRVVEAYWVGNGLLEAAGGTGLAEFVDGTFGTRAGRHRADLATTAFGAVPHHSFHVFAVYPWVGLLRAGRVEEPLRVLDGCRIRWGTVVSVAGPVAVVSARPLEWTGDRLRLGARRPEVVTVSADGLGLAGPLHPGDVVSMHWDWVCDRLDARSLRALSRATARSLAAVNAAARPPSAAFA